MKIYKYLENYSVAYAGFKEAFRLDPKLTEAKKEMENLKSMIKKIDQLIKNQVKFSAHL